MIVYVCLMININFIKWIEYRSLPLKSDELQKFIIMTSALGDPNMKSVQFNCFMSTAECFAYLLAQTGKISRTS